MGDRAHPCLSCGACCATMRVSFYWGEPVPEELTVAVSPFRSAMRGTECAPVRCAALDGVLGERVSCRIYDQRPSPCREFRASGEDGRLDVRCDEVREKIGLPPLSFEDFPVPRAGGAAVPHPGAPRAPAGAPDVDPGLGQPGWGTTGPVAPQGAAGLPHHSKKIEDPPISITGTFAAVPLTRI